MVCFVDGPCPKCDPHNPDESCPECHGYGMVGWCEERGPSTPRTETDWSRAMATALIRNRMTLGESRGLTGLGVVRLSRLKNGESPPTDEERDVLERALGFSSGKISQKD